MPIFQLDQGDCPNPNVPLLIGVHERRRKAIFFRPRCKLWSCPVCGPANSWLWAYRINAGAHALHERGYAIDFVCITSHERLSPRQSFWVAPRAWKVLQQRIRRIFISPQYAAIPEVQANGRVHFHIITNVQLTKKWWKTNARECGFGYMSDAREVYDLGGVVGYVAKYLTKSLDLDDMPKGTRRVRLSRGYPRPAAPAPQGWQFSPLGRLAIDDAIHEYARRGYDVALAGSKRAWMYVDSVDGD